MLVLVLATAAAVVDVGTAAVSSAFVAVDTVETEVAAAVVAAVDAETPAVAVAVVASTKMAKKHSPSPRPQSHYSHCQHPLLSRG